MQERNYFLTKPAHWRFKWRMSMPMLAFQQGSHLYLFKCRGTIYLQIRNITPALSLSLSALCYVIPISHNKGSKKYILQTLRHLFKVVPHTPLKFSVTPTCSYDQYLLPWKICALSRITNYFVKELNSMALVRKRTIPTERTPHVEVGANFCGYGVSRGQRNGSPRPLISVFYNPEQLLFNSSSSSVILTRPSGPRSRPTTFQKI
jgi:hypothetical protein